MNVFVDSYRYLSSSLDSLVKTLVDNSHKTIKKLRKEFVVFDELLNIVSEIGEGEERAIEYIKKDYPDENKRLEGASNNYV